MDVVELRQYTLHPGQRDVLVELFDREFVESQDGLGAFVLGQFRDLDEPDRFVWLRGFADMASRRKALTDFYTGPVWKANAKAANATMIDSDDVLLLRPVAGGPRLATPAARPPAGSTELPDSRVLAIVCLGERPLDGAALTEVLRGTGDPLAALVTEYAENDFPALPVRDEHAFVWLAGFESLDDLDAAVEKLQTSVDWPGLSGPPGFLRLAPTARSAVR